MSDAAVADHDRPSAVRAGARGRRERNWCRGVTFVSSRRHVQVLLWPGHGCCEPVQRCRRPRPRRARRLASRLARWSRAKPAAQETLRQNLDRFFPHAGGRGDLRRRALRRLRGAPGCCGLESGEVDLLHGGPPCTPFSKSGYWLAYKRAGEDPKASLLDNYVEAASRHPPEGVPDGERLRLAAIETRTAQCSSDSSPGCERRATPLTWRR